MARVVPDGGSGAACVGAPVASLDQLWPTYFAPAAPTGCATAGCHGGGAGGFSFSTAPEMWAASVGQLSQLDPGMQRVAPGDPLHSYLYLKLLPTASGRMPLGGPTYLDDAGLAAVLGWICAGAPSPTNPLPVLSSISPATVSAGTGAFSLAVAGSGFVPGSAVEVDGAPRTTHYLFSTQLTADVLASDVAGAGVRTITVFNAAPGGGTSASATLTVSNQPNPVPAPSSIVPGVVPVGSSAISLTVNGSGFVVSSSVLVDGTARTTHYVSGAQLTADLPAGDFAAAGSRTIAVFNPAPGGGTSGGLALAVRNLPAISSLQPCGVVAGAGAFTLTVNGANFANGATATFGGTSVAATFVSSTQLTAAIPSALVATAPADDAVPVVVTNPGPDVSNVAYFGVATKPSSLAANVQPIFTASCATAGCHVENPPAVQGLRTYAVQLDLTSGDVIVDLLAGTSGFPDLVGGTVIFKVADFPQLSQPGGSVEGIPGGWGQPLLVMALPGGTFAAVGAACTHLGCAVGYSAARNDVECPCHGSIFTTGGAVLQGPASLPLPSYPATSDGTAVTVKLV